MNTTTSRPAAPAGPGWLATDDAWAILLGLGLVALALALYLSGSTLNWLAVTPARWSTLADLGGKLVPILPRLVALFAVFAVLFGIAARSLGLAPGSFIASFAALFAASALVFIAGAWDRAQTYGIEAPFLALIVGLAISNTLALPPWLGSAFRVEFYIKIGIVLLGASFPFSLIVWAGPVALLQASIVSLITFGVIYFVSLRLGLDRRLAATMGAGGAVCGVSAAIAVAGAVRADKSHAPIAFTLVIGWALVMVFVLPLVAHGLGLSPGVAGAWIGTSEFADAAGLAAAQAYGGLSASPGQSGDTAVLAFTLMKVIGRDLWIGVWAFVLALVATTRWETTVPGARADAGEIWRRFPKFVIGFLIVSATVSAVSANVAFGDFNKIVKPGLVAPLATLRVWAFVFCFFSIGLTTRFRDFIRSGAKPFWAFTAGVIVNVVLGFVLSTAVFGDFWSHLAP